MSIDAWLALALFALVTSITPGPNNIMLVASGRISRFIDKHPTMKMLALAFDGITSFSTVPLRMATWLGLLAGMVAIGGVGWALSSKFFGGVVRGWTTIMILVSLASCAQLVMMGILGEYVARIHHRVLREPSYVVRERAGEPVDG